MKKLMPSEERFWTDYLQTLAEIDRPIQPFVTAAFAGNAEITDELLNLYLSGVKSAGSSIVEDFLTVGDPLPAVGNYWIYLNSRSLPCCILKTERIQINKFQDVPVSIAIAEGEGDRSLSYWRSVHSSLYTPHLKSWGLARMEDAHVITEFFSIVYRGE